MVKSGGTKVPLPKPSNGGVFNVGDTLVCTKSASCGYKEGNTYTVYANDKGWKCLKADDGFEDIMSFMVSSFRKD